MIPLEAFCAREAGRFAIDRPFIQAGWRYYTDGAVGIRVRYAADDEGDDEGDVPLRAAAVFEAAASGGEPTEVWPAVELAAVRVVETCKECRGRGVWQCDCPDCETEEHTCAFCDGAGREIVWRRQDLAGVPFGGGYVWLIGQLPGVRYRPPVLDHRGLEGCGPVWFRFDGGEGLLMPRRDSPDNSMVRCRIDLAIDHVTRGAET